MSLILEALERARKDKDVPDPVEVARVLAHQKMARRPRERRVWPLVALLVVVVGVTAAAGVAVVHYFLQINLAQRIAARAAEPPPPATPPAHDVAKPAPQELPVAGPANLAPPAMPVAVSDQLPPPMPLSQPQPPPFGVYAPAQPAATQTATQPPPSLAAPQAPPLQPANQPVAGPPAALDPAAPPAVAQTPVPEPAGGSRVSGGFSLGTILYDKNMRIAVINGQMVHEGQKTDTFSVLKITPNTVTVQKPGQAPITLRTN